MKRLLLPFVASWWLSPLCMLLCAGLWCVGGLIAAEASSRTILSGAGILGRSGLVGFAVFLSLGLAAVVRALVLRRWGRAVAAFLATGACFLVSFVAAGMVTFMLLFADNDHFADDLSVPEGIAIAEPGERDPWPAQSDRTGEDAYSATVTNALARPGTADATVTAVVPSFERLARGHRDLLLAYFSAHPGWRVFEERGSLYATRAMSAGGEWFYPLHGYYSDFSHRTDPDGADEGRKEPYQVRLTVGFPDPWAKRGLFRLASGETAVVPVAGGNPGTMESHLAVFAGPACIEIFEESATPERRLTKALLALLEDELRPLAESPDPATLRALLPPGSAVRGEKPGIFLKDAGQGGIYAVRVLANPGEPGLVYLKAFEVTKGTPLSATRLPDRSSLRLGWSDDPGELFSGTTEITIYEGNWEQYYAARFELWFRPDSAAPERKLAEKVYRIQGWMR